MFCSNCGFQFEGNFCPRCGKPAPSASAPPDGTPTSPPAPAPPTGYAANPAPPMGYAANPAPPTGYAANPPPPTGYAANPAPPTGYAANPAPYGANPIPYGAAYPPGRTGLGPRALLQTAKLVVGILSIIASLLTLAYGMVLMVSTDGLLIWLLGRDAPILLVVVGVVVCWLTAGILGITGGKSRVATWVACGLYVLSAVPGCILTVAGLFSPAPKIVVLQMGACTILPIGAAVLFGASAVMSKRKAE